MFVKKLLKVGLVALFALNVLYADTVRITKDTANVRSGASTQNRVIGKIHKGDGYNLIRTTGQWIKISFKGDYGWIYNSGINIEEDVEEVTSGGCFTSDTASLIAPSIVNGLCCLAVSGFTVGAGCIACTTIIQGGDFFGGIFYEENMDKMYEGAFCD
jgi:hypothetical protein